MKQVKTLFDFYSELSEINFEKKKAQGLVKRANAAGYPIYYAYHEDESDTWRRGWSENDYKKDESDCKIFECTNLIGKKKPTASFTRAQTYTAECAIFIFCPLHTMMQDEVLRERKIEQIKRRAEKTAISNYNEAMAIKVTFEKWQKLPLINRQQITRLNAKNGNRNERRLNDRIAKRLGGIPRPLCGWSLEACQFKNVSDFVEHKQNIAVKYLIKEAAAQMIESE